ncbi:hypothetical protein B0H16DRAFT_1466770 [Mycena metata]|uniref:Uncharacterized protein n=1 Tax=Mycena metata TaxID=1033252 RepID=A0AAD7I6R7_9AGAR|nr:hypothetical protein B0H16DRAFT_1466770 [Mycena metata]
MSEDALVPVANNFEGPPLGKDFPADAPLFPGRPRWFTSSMGFISMDFDGLEFLRFGHHPVQAPIYAAPDFSRAWLYLPLCPILKDVFVINELEDALDRRDQDFVHDFIQVKDLYYAITGVDTIIKNDVRAVFDAWDGAGDRKARIDVCRSEEEAEKVVADDKSDRQYQVSPTDSPISYSPVSSPTGGSVRDDAWEKEHWLSPRWD